MMGVYIKGMEMPKHCHQCKLRGTIDCSPLKGLSPHDAVKDCPLIEVPEPHGRLVEFIEVATQDEEDSGTELINLGDVFAAYMEMREARPVIEAEGE